MISYCLPAYLLVTFSLSASAAVQSTNLRCSLSAAYVELGTFYLSSILSPLILRNRNPVGFKTPTQSATSAKRHPAENKK